MLPVAGLSADGLFISGLSVPGFSILPVDGLFVPGFSGLPVDGLFVPGFSGLPVDGLFVSGFSGLPVDGLFVPGSSGLPVDGLSVPGSSGLPVDGLSVPGLLLSSDTSSFASAVSSIVPYTDDLDQPMPVSSFQLKVPIRVPEASASFIWNSRPILSPSFGCISVHLNAASITYPSPVTFAEDCTFSSRHFFPLKECSFS